MHDGICGTVVVNGVAVCSQRGDYRFGCYSGSIKNDPLGRRAGHRWGRYGLDPEVFKLPADRGVSRHQRGGGPYGDAAHLGDDSTLVVIKSQFVAFPCAERVATATASVGRGLSHM